MLQSFYSHFANHYYISRFDSFFLDDPPSTTLSLYIT